MADQVPNSITKAINSEIGTAFARVSMFLALPALGLLGYLVHDWVTEPVAALAARVTILEQDVPQATASLHQDELKIGVMQNSMDMGRADRLSATDDTKAALSALNAKTDQLQSAVSTMSATLAGVAATLDVMKEHNVASLPGR